MIDLHTHSLLSDGVLLPSELVRRAQVVGYRAIAITDHVDHSNIDMVLPALVRVSKELNRYWDILVIPGVEITHVPIETISSLERKARDMGARIVVVHGESPVEPVIPGTNAAAIASGVDILAHPGMITPEDAGMAAEKGVYLEITSRRGHSNTNMHVFETAIACGAKLVLNTDTHEPGNLISDIERNGILGSLTDSQELISEILENSETIVRGIRQG